MLKQFQRELIHPHSSMFCRHFHEHWKINVFMFFARDVLSIRRALSNRRATRDEQGCETFLEQACFLNLEKYMNCCDVLFVITSLAF